MIPVLMFEPDGYVLDGPKLMGRQSAGNGFLRAAIKAVENSQGDKLLNAWTAKRASAEVFARIVNSSAPSVRPEWIPTDRLDLLANHGALFLPGPGLAEASRQRLRAGPGSWSLTGATYTLCSHGAMDSIIDMLSAPVMPWDALICATSVAKHAVQTLFELQGEYLAWRFGIRRFSVPQLPIIPFGVHQSDFDFTDRDRQHARNELSIGSDEVVVLFAGRLSFHAKAHPFPMLVALQEAALRSKTKTVLVLCGQFPNDAVKNAFLDAALRYAPSVKTIWVDGKNSNAYRNAWAVGDLFVSLSDNLQETFGITPVEAMACGMPVLVTDWDGYKDTVVDGVTGYRIPTWMPPPDIGMSLAAAFEAGTINYDHYIGLSCLQVSVDNQILIERLVDLLKDPSTRARMGAAGRERVSKVYDWSVVMGQHIELWSNLDEYRRKAVVDQADVLSRAPRCAPGRQDPYRVFSSFTTNFISPTTYVGLSSNIWLVPSWDSLVSDALFSFAKDFLPGESATNRVIEVLSEKRLTMTELSKSLGISVAEAIRLISPMAKVGVVNLSPNPI